MKRYLALPALALTTLFAGVSTVQAPIATAQEAPAQTMADRYQPYYEPVYERTDDSIVVRIHGDYPSGTEFTLSEPNWPNLGTANRYFLDGPLNTMMFGIGGHIHIFAEDDLPEYGDDGYTTHVDVLVTYPDGSAEVVTASPTIAASMAQLSPTNYSDAWVESGATETFSPENDSHTPTSFNFVQSTALDTYREQGWDFTIDSSTGDISVTAPEGEGEELNLSVYVVYEDGSNETVDANFRSGVEPTPEPQPDQDQEQDQNQEPTPEPQPKGGSSSGLGSSSLFSFLGNIF